MKLLLAFSCLVLAVSAGYAPYVYHGPPAPLAHDGTVLDTPEVAHAKAAHLAAHAAEAAKTGGSGGHGYADYGDAYAYGAHGHAAPAFAHVPAGYHGPGAPLAHDGRVVDTPEVAHAKAAHLSAHAEQIAKLAQASYLDPQPHTLW